MRKYFFTGHTDPELSDVMKRAALLTGCLLMIYGCLILVVAVIYAFLVIVKTEGFALVFGIGGGAITLLFLSGVLSGAIGLALFSYAKQ